MKEKDFEDIGKRLYDLEANPPKGGWRKIGTAIGVPGTGGKQVWLQKHWWKPLIILLPALVYVGYLGLQEGSSTVLEHVADSLDAESPLTSSSDHNKLSKEDSEPKINDTAIAQPEKGGESTSLDKSEGEKQDEAKLSGRSGSTVVPEKTKENENRAQGPFHGNKTRLDAKAVVVTPALSKATSARSDEAVPSLSPAVTDRVEKSDSANRARTESVALLPLNEIDSASLTNRQAAVHTGNEAAAADSAMKAEPETGVPLRADSTGMKAPDESREEDNHSAGWRLGFSLMPQFTARNITPDTDDELLVTGVSGSEAPARPGWGVALGISKTINDNFQVDGQLSWMSMRQDFDYTYTDGTVDTLLATLQADQTVLVTPVYLTSDRHIESTYNYGGLHLGATYYFWDTRRRRFSLNASAGIRYLLSARVKEQINGEWITLSDDGLNRFNSSFSVGAGYSMLLNKGWEVTVSPTLTYFLLEVKSSELPYNLNQHSIGVNFMLTKTLGSK